jgi:hypothetical protein
VNEPFRFWMAPNSQRRVIILDRHIEFYRYEHSLMNPRTGREDTFLPCPNHIEGCPICASGKNPYYAMYLTVIDPEGYQPKDATKPYVEWSRKLLIVKSGMQNKWLRFEEQHSDGEDGIRGAVVELYRDTDKEPRSGADLQFIEWAPDLSIYVRTRMGQNNQTVEEDCSEPCNYMELYPEMSEEEVAKAAGVPYRPSAAVAGRPFGRQQSAAPLPGSDAETDSVLNGEFSAEEDDLPWDAPIEEDDEVDAPEPSASSRRSESRGRPAASSRPVTGRPTARAAEPAQRTAAPAARTRDPSERPAVRPVTRPTTRRR